MTYFGDKIWWRNGWENLWVWNWESERPIMNLFTVGSLIICVDLELFIPAKEAYLDLMGLDHSTNIGELQTLFPEKTIISWKRVRSIGRPGKWPPRNFDRKSPSFWEKNGKKWDFGIKLFLSHKIFFTNYFSSFTLSFMFFSSEMAAKAFWTVLSFCGIKFETNHCDLSILLKQ